MQIALAPFWPNISVDTTLSKGTPLRDQLKLSTPSACMGTMASVIIIAAQTQVQTKGKVP